MGRAGRPSGENKIEFDPLRELREEGLPPGWIAYWQGERGDPGPEEIEVSKTSSMDISLPLDGGGEAFLYAGDWGLDNSNQRREGYWGDLMLSSWGGEPSQTAEEALLLLRDYFECQIEDVRDEYGSIPADDETEINVVAAADDGLFDGLLVDPETAWQQSSSRDWEWQPGVPEDLKFFLREVADSSTYSAEEIEDMIENTIDPLLRDVDMNNLRMDLARRNIEKMRQKKAETLQELNLSQEELDEAAKAIELLPSWQYGDSGVRPEGAINRFHKDSVMHTFAGRRRPQSVQEVQRSARIAADALASSNPRLAAKFSRLASQYDQDTSTTTAI